VVTLGGAGEVRISCGSDRVSLQLLTGPTIVIKGRRRAASSPLACNSRINGMIRKHFSLERLSEATWARREICGCSGTLVVHERIR